MKRILLTVCFLLCAAFCFGCAEDSDEAIKPGRRREAASVTPTPTELPTPTPTPSPTPTQTPTPTPSPTPVPDDDRIHTMEFGYTPEQVLSYYLETGLQPEYAKGQNYNFVKKWKTTVIVRVEGSPDDDDREVMRNLFEQLNQVKGFPGIRLAKEGEEPSLIIRFLPKDEYEPYAKAAIGDELTDGYSLIWFRYGIIYEAEIGIVNDLTRTNKNHVILEEIVQSLGLQDDSYSYPDSLFYQGYNEPQRPSDLDWLLVRFLYHEKMQPLMEKPEIQLVAEEVLAE